MATMCRIHQLYTVLFSLFSCFLHAATNTQEEKHGSGTADLLSGMSSSHLALAGVLSTVVLLLVVVLVVAGCMDCMNKEVSSDNHPACASPTSKWGGATDYMSSSIDGHNPHFTTGDLPNPSVNHTEPLPYPFTSHHVPEQAGFCGFQYVNRSGRGEGGLVGYGATGMGAEEPPPPYSQIG